MNEDGILNILDVVALVPVADDKGIGLRVYWISPVTADAGVGTM